MAGRPPLRIGQHGKITRTELEKGVWVARCRYRDTDGVTRVVERKSPGSDQWGKKAEDALLEALTSRQAPGGGDIALDTKIITLMDTHITHLIGAGKADRTIDTYRYTMAKFAKIIGAVRVREATPPRLDAALRSMSTAHGLGMARMSKTLLRAGLQLAVMAGVLPTNPVRDVLWGSGNQKHRPKGAVAVGSAQFLALLDKLEASEACRERDLVDPITMLMATGLRRSELLGLRWVDYDATARIVTVTGKLVRAKGKGLRRVEETKTEAGTRALSLPKFAVDMLTTRRETPYYGEQEMIFPSTAGSWRDPEHFNTHWREVRDELGLPNVTSHSFRKSVATLIDETGLSARVGADQLGHARVSMTQDVYMSRKQVHTAVADLLDKAAGR